MSLTVQQINYLKSVVDSQSDEKYLNIVHNTSIKVYDYHIKKTGLKTAKLLLYELIYGFTIGTPNGIFEGSAEYLAKRLGIHRQKVLEYLKELTDCGYIYKIIKNGFPVYCAADIVIPKNDAGYFIVDHRYIEELKLKGIELLIYSYINGLTRSGMVFWDTQTALSKKLNISAVSVCNCLKQLEEKGYIRKYSMDSVVQELCSCCGAPWFGKYLYAGEDCDMEVTDMLNTYIDNQLPIAE